jgi:DNA-binding beta-propeller fold protein YncE
VALRFLFVFCVCVLSLTGCGGKLGSPIVVRSKMLYVASESSSDIHCFDLEVDEGAEPEGTETWPIYRESTFAPIARIFLAPNLKWMFALTTLGHIEMFECRRSGRLNRLASPVLPDGLATKALALSIDSTRLYVASDGGQVYGFSIDSAGTVALLPQAGLPGPTVPVAAAIRPDGKALYMVDRANNKIWQYGIGVNGALESLSPASFEVSGGPSELLWNVAGSRLYVSCADSNQVAFFSTVASGELTEIGRVAAPGSPSAPVLSLDETFMFVASSDGSKEIWRYQVSPVPAVLNPARVTNHEIQVDAQLDPGDNLFLLNGNSDSFSQYRIQNDGTLSLMETVDVRSNPSSAVHRRLVE